MGSRPASAIAVFTILRARAYTGQIHSRKLAEQTKEGPSLQGDYKGECLFSSIPQGADAQAPLTRGNLRSSACRIVLNVADEAAQLGSTL